MDTPLKIAVTGKGGVGKTTVAALLCRAFVESGHSVIAVDADPDANLGAAAGIGNDDSIVPLASMHSLIEERTGAAPDSVGSFFKINPHVADLPEKLWQEQDGIRLLKMGTVKQGGSGCICPASAMLKAMIQNLILYRNEAVIMDMEAGIEHLSRRTDRDVDIMLVVTDPSKMGFETAKRIRELIEEVHIGVKKTYLVGNRFPPQLLDVLEKAADDVGFELAGNTPEDSNVQSFNMTGKPLLDIPEDSPSYRAVEEIAEKIGLKELV